MTPSQARAGRALLDWSQTRLAKESGLGLSTIVDYEKQRRHISEIARNLIREALVDAGIIFIDPNGEGPGVRLRKENFEADVAERASKALRAIKSKDEKA
ncbi:DNA-binding protein [Aminobacter sp. Y103A]|uniref:helix-turn-helix domain-containing protein n=1 Tax=Aminobacter sp. Y103A TaxID=1870862 RepID=UPI0025730D2F|nr:helix-turn-helix transcriptional regulator [Aminobacter sp. SS-2016]BBD37475.1 DNA-binding protein [Aminobacter sp. SS-2016]